MIDFGYTINPDSQIDFDMTDKTLAKLIIKTEPTFSRCFSCGTCSSGCTIGQNNSYNPHKLYLLVKRGEIKGLQEELSKCILCGKCQLACPRGVNTRNILFHLKKYFEINQAI